jgi:hypothetical protein
MSYNDVTRGCDAPRVLKPTGSQSRGLALAFALVLKFQRWRAKLDCTISKPHFLLDTRSTPGKAP